MINKRAVSIAIGAAFALAITPTSASATHGFDKDCGDFGSQSSAQYHLNAHPGDPDGLDADKDGIACESNKCPCYYGSGTQPEPAPTTTPSPSPSPSPTPITEAAPPPASAKTYRAKILGVIDGDTLKVRLSSGSRKTVRVIGIDTPETRKPGVAVECGAKKATAYMTKLAFRRSRRGRTGHSVALRTDPTQDSTDRYGRLLAYVGRASGGVDLGESMIRAGWAATYVYDNKPFQRFGRYSKAESQAKATRAGVHALCGGDFHSEQ